MMVTVPVGYSVGILGFKSTKPKLMGGNVVGDKDYPCHLVTKYGHINTSHKRKAFAIYVILTMVLCADFHSPQIQVEWHL